MTRVCICCKYRINKCVSDISLYAFPRDDETLKKWLLAIGTAKKISESSRICSRHFKENDFRYSLVGGKRFLKQKVVPSLCLNGEIEDNQFCNGQNTIPEENQSIDIADKHVVRATESELLSITKSETIGTKKGDPLSCIIEKRDEISKFVPRDRYGKSQIPERVSSSSGRNELKQKCKRYLYDVQWEEISTSPVQAKIYWEVVIEKIRRQKLTLRTLRQKVKRLRKKILQLHVQVKDIPNNDVQ